MSLRVWVRVVGSRTRKPAFGGRLLHLLFMLDVINRFEEVVGSFVVHLCIGQPDGVFVVPV